MRRLVFVFLAACGGSAASQPTIHAQAAATAKPVSTPAMQVARSPEVHFTGVGLLAYGAMLQSGNQTHMTGEGPAPHSNMDVADVQCQAENVLSSPFKVTCSNGKSAITDPSGKQFRDRLEACFHTNVVTLPPRVLRAIEASIYKGPVPASPAVRPDTTTPFVSVDVDLHVVSKPNQVPIFENECKDVPHPCDPVFQKIVGYKPADPNAPATETRTHAFVGFGPDGYEVRPFVASPGPIFRAVGVMTIYAAPMLEGDKPDPRFVVQRYAYPPNSWEPPPKVSEATVKEAYARIALLDPDRENDATQVAIYLDRAVLAFAMRDDAAAKRHMHELDAWLAKHPNALPADDYAKRGIETLHLLERGTLSITDPCAVR